MEYFPKIISTLFLSLILTQLSAQDFSQNEDSNYIQETYKRSLQDISNEKTNASENQTAVFLNENFLTAPNSYVYDLELAKTQNYAGLKIPVTKAFAVWSNADWYLNQPLNSNRTLTAYLYWEDVPGLIEEVDIELAPQKENSKISVKVNPKKGKGNALISLHLGNNGNADDPIVWSWHVWVTDDPSNGTSYGQGIETDKNGNLFTPQYMDRNLGAVHQEILGDDWHKTSGLMYQWGRKDPIPPLVHKDFSFYEITGLIGVIRNREEGSRGNKLPEYQRPFESITQNLRLSVKNPLVYLLNGDNGTWFSSEQYKVNHTDPNNLITWDLWADNYRGGNSNGNSSNTALKNDSRSYEFKSPYDPCPNGWRIPSYMGRATVNNNLGPWGRRASGTNDDTDPSKNTFYPNQSNSSIMDAKVHSGLGIDFTGAHQSNGTTRDIGIIPMSGYYVSYPNNGTPTVVYQDENAISAHWSATYSIGGARYMRVVTDPLRPDIGPYGLNQILVNQTSKSMEAMPIRCMQDPNLALTGNFETEYFTASKTYFTDGLENPNSYIIHGETEILIPVNKAFSAYEQLFPENEPLAYNELIAKVFWSDNSNLIQSAKVISAGGDPKNDFIRVQINPAQKGNAVISLHNGSISEAAYWSWHIWSVADEIQEITYVNQNTLDATHNFVLPTGGENPVLTTTFMDRNLGAIHDLPIEIMENPSSPELQNQVKYSGGLHYQWGRKDPIPSFQFVGGESYEIYLGTAMDSNGAPSFTAINQLSYVSQFTEIYTNYRLEVGLVSGDTKYDESDKVIQYAVEHPFTYLHKSVTGFTDWVSGSYGLKPERWGHGGSKSVYDPCPSGWRVPDTFKVYENGKGSSPWYNGKKLGSLQGNPQFINSHYGGEYFQYNNKPVGWFFTDPDYQIGHFPTTGIIGKFSPNTVGGNNKSESITGVWTAALTQQLKGHALAMSIGRVAGTDQKVISTGNISPAYGLNVRCAKDEIRYDGTMGNDYFQITKKEYKSAITEDEIRVYPNPAKDFLHISSDQNFNIEIYDIQGKLVKKGQFTNGKIDIRSLEKGIYIGLLMAENSSEIITVKIIKE